MVWYPPILVLLGNYLFTSLSTHTHTHIHARLPGVLLFVSSRPSVAGFSFVSGFFKTNGQDRASRDRDRDRAGSGATERVGLTKDKGNKPLN